MTLLFLVFIQQALLLLEVMALLLFFHPQRVISQNGIYLLSNWPPVLVTRNNFSFFVCICIFPLAISTHENIFQFLRFLKAHKHLVAENCVNAQFCVIITQN